MHHYTNNNYSYHASEDHFPGTTFVFVFVTVLLQEVATDLGFLLIC